MQAGHNNDSEDMQHQGTAERQPVTVSVPYRKLRRRKNPGPWTSSLAHAGFPILDAERTEVPLKKILKMSVSVGWNVKISCGMQYGEGSQLMTSGIFQPNSANSSCGTVSPLDSNSLKRTTAISPGVIALHSFVALHFASAGSVIVRDVARGSTIRQGIAAGLSDSRRTCPHVTSRKCRGLQGLPRPSQATAQPRVD